MNIKNIFTHDLGQGVVSYTSSFKGVECFLYYLANIEASPALSTSAGNNEQIVKVTARAITFFGCV